MQNTASLPADQFNECASPVACGAGSRSARAGRPKPSNASAGVDRGPDLLRLALARGPGGLSLSEAAAWATMLGLARMSEPGGQEAARQGSGRSSDAVMASLLAEQDARHRGALARTRPARMPTVVATASAAARRPVGGLHAVYDLGRGGFSHLELTDEARRRGDRARRADPRARSALATAILPVPRACDASASKVRTRRISSFG